MRALLLAALTVPLAACDLNPILGKPSEAQQHHERSTQPAEGVNFVQAAISVPACAGDEFRVHRCVDGVKQPWSYQ